MPGPGQRAGEDETADALAQGDQHEPGVEHQLGEARPAGAGRSDARPAAPRARGWRRSRRRRFGVFEDGFAERPRPGFLWRTSTRQPRDFSSAATTWDTADWLIRGASAVALNPPSPATVSNARQLRDVDRHEEPSSMGQICLF
ncbi:hypothetical protein ACWDKQ_09825 [Saccharopolyspora sp. NPDC000995]